MPEEIDQDQTKYGPDIFYDVSTEEMLQDVSTEGIEVPPSADESVEGTKTFFTRHFRGHKVPSVVTSLMFVACTLLTAFLASSAYVFECALGSDEVASLYLMTEVTAAATGSG